MFEEWSVSMRTERAGSRRARQRVCGAERSSEYGGRVPFRIYSAHIVWHVLRRWGAGWQQLHANEFMATE